jgi:hypothetical protein
VGIISGATDWAKVVVMSEGMVDWLALYVDMSSGILVKGYLLVIFRLVKEN